jgi:hypothetical protein
MNIYVDAMDDLKKEEMAKYAAKAECSTKLEE